MTGPWQPIEDPWWLDRQDRDFAWREALALHSQQAAGVRTNPRDVEPFATVWVIDETWMPYMAKAVIEATARGPQCVELTLVARADGEPITPAGLRRVPLGRIVRLVEDRLAATLTLDESGRPAARSQDEERRIRAKYRRAVTVQQKEGRRWVLDAGQLAQVADVYRRALATGGHPTAAVQDYFKLGTRAQAAKWVKRAREEGHLGPAPGRRLKGEQ